MLDDPKESARSAAAAAIRAAWSGAQSNDEAAANLLKAMRADPELYRSVVEPFEVRAALLAVSAHKRAVRSYVFNRPAEPDLRVAALARSNAVTLLDMRLTTGRRLGDALRPEIEAERDFYTARERDMRRKAGFFDRILERLPTRGRKSVAQVWTAEELERIRDNA